VRRRSGALAASTVRTLPHRSQVRRKHQAGKARSVRSSAWEGVGNGSRVIIDPLIRRSPLFPRGREDRPLACEVSEQPITAGDVASALGHRDTQPFRRVCPLRASAIRNQIYRAWPGSAQRVRSSSAFPTAPWPVLAVLAISRRFRNNAAVSGLPIALAGHLRGGVDPPRLPGLLGQPKPLQGRARHCTVVMKPRRSDVRFQGARLRLSILRPLLAESRMGCVRYPSPFHRLADRARAAGAARFARTDAGRRCSS